MKILIALFLLIPVIAFGQGNTNRVIFSNPSNQFTGTFNGNGTALTNVSIGTNLAAGLTYDDATNAFDQGIKAMSVTVGKTYYFIPDSAHSYICVTGGDDLNGTVYTTTTNFVASQTTVYLANDLTFGDPILSKFYGPLTTNVGIWSGIVDTNSTTVSGIPTLAGNQTFTGINKMSNSDFRGSNFLGRATVITNTTGRVSGTINTFLLTVSSNGFANLLFGDDIAIGNAQYCVLAVTNSTTAVVQLLPNGPLAASYTNSAWSIYRCAAYITDINGTLIGAIRGDGGIIMKSGSAFPSSAFFGVFAGVDNATGTPSTFTWSGGNKTTTFNAPNQFGGGAFTIHPGATYDTISALDNSFAYFKVGITNAGDEVLNGTYTRNTTNAAPNAVTVGTTAPDLWFPIINGSTTYYMPAWKAH